MGGFFFDFEAVRTVTRDPHAGANQDSPLRCYPGGLSLSRSIGDVTLKYHPKKVVVGDPEVVRSPRFEA